MDNLILDITFSDTGPEPVTLGDAKAWLKIDVPDDDILLSETLIPAARQSCENFLNMSLINRKITAFLQIGLEEMPLPYGPVKDVESVSDMNGNPITGYVLNYETFKAIDPAREIKIVYNAGFNSALPKVFKLAILNQLAYDYEHRGDEAETKTIALPVKRLLRPFRRVT